MRTSTTILARGLLLGSAAAIAERLDPISGSNSVANNRPPGCNLIQGGLSDGKIPTCGYTIVMSLEDTTMNLLPSPFPSRLPTAPVVPAVLVGSPTQTARTASPARPAKQAKPTLVHVPTPAVPYAPQLTSAARAWPAKSAAHAKPAAPVASAVPIVSAVPIASAVPAASSPEQQAPEAPASAPIAMPAEDLEAPEDTEGWTNSDASEEGAPTLTAENLQAIENWGDPELAQEAATPAAPSRGNLRGWKIPQGWGISENSEDAAPFAAPYAVPMGWQGSAAPESWEEAEDSSVEDSSADDASTDDSNIEDERSEGSSIEDASVDNESDVDDEDSDNDDESDKRAIPGWPARVRAHRRAITFTA